MGRFWSLLFLLVPILGVGIFVWAMADWWPMQGHWLPENINDHGGVIDSLFMFILLLTGVIFIATGLVLFWFLWKYDAGAERRSRSPSRTAATRWKSSGRSCRRRRWCSSPFIR